jgi:hypothetical protein
MANFLELRCPACGGEDRIDIRASVWIRACDDGFNAEATRRGGYDYDLDSVAVCRACDHHGVLRQFEVPGSAP